MSSDKLTIIKMPENNTVSLSVISPGGYKMKKKVKIWLQLWVDPSNMSSGEPLQRLMVCYPKSKFGLSLHFMNF